MIANFFNKNRDVGILLIRVAVGLAFVLVYGRDKLFLGPEFWAKIGSAMGNFGIHFAPAFWGFLFSSAEFIGGIFLVLGLFTRPVAFFMAFNMFVAAMTHFAAHDPWMRPIVPVQLFAIFIAMIFFGAGKYSIDNFISNIKQKRNSKEEVKNS